MRRHRLAIFSFLFAAAAPLAAQNVLEQMLPTDVPVAPGRLSLEQIVARADSLHCAYCFEEAIGLYLSAGREDKAALSQNALNLIDFCAEPHVVARQRFSRKDFFLYYPLKTHSWYTSPNQLDSAGGFPVYYPKGADAIYFSALDRAGTRSLFVTEDLDTLWRSPRMLGEAQLSTGSEIFPMLSPDGQTLYFASDGLFGMGGYDLYSCTWDPDSGRWLEPVNMGYPFNSPADDFLLVDTEDGKYTLFASNRDCSRDSVYIYVLDYGSSRVRRPVRSLEELRRIASLSPVRDLARIDNASAVSSEVGNANTRLYARKMEEARALADSIAVQQDPARRDSLQLLLEEVNLEIRLVEQTFLQSGAVAQEEDREVVGASQSYTFAKNAPASRLKLALEQRVVTPSFRVAPVGRFAMDHTLPEGIVYQIEAFSSPRHATLEDIKGLMPVYEKLSTQLQYTYSVGIYTHYWEALLDLNRVRLQGFPRARIVAYRDGRRIPLSEARNEEL